MRGQAEHLSPLDASFLEIEQADECSHMHIGWAMLFEPLPDGGPPSVARVRQVLDERLDLLPRFRRRLSSARTGRFSWPTWVPDERFRIEDHVRHATLAPPGRESDLLEWLADFFSHRLDRGRPLWEITLLDGLTDGGWALVAKVHHSLVDGISGVSVANLLLDSSPDQAVGERGLLASLPLEPETDEARHSLVGRGARAGIGAFRHPRKLLERTRALAELVIREELIAAPHTSFNVPIGGSRRMAIASCGLADVKGVKNRLGGTVNDVVLAAATGALRGLLQERGNALPTRGLRVMVPVSIRGAGEQLALGNRVSSLFVELPVAEPDPLVRYRKVVGAAQSLKSGGQAVGTETLLDVAGLAPPAVHALVARLAFTPRLFNLTITNVPGPQATLYGLGARMRRVIPLVPIFADHAVGIAVVSYDGELVFGLNGDSGAMRDIDRLAVAFERSLAELGQLAGVPAVTEAVVATR